MSERRIIKILIPMVIGVASSLVVLSKDYYELSIVPQFSAAKIESKWNPIIEHVENETGIILKLKHYKTIPEFEEFVVSGTPDFAYMNPYHAYRANQLQGYQPLIRDKTKLLFGQLWVRGDSGIDDLSDLNGKNIAFPAPNAFGASLYMRALLTNAEGVQFKPKYVKTHSNVYRHVALGRSSAGGGVARTYNAEPESLKSNLRKLYETPGVRPHPLCAHERVPVEVQEAVANAIIGLLDKGDDGQQRLKNIGIPIPVRSDFKTDYEPLGELRLSDFVEGSMK